MKIFYSFVVFILLSVQILEAQKAFMDPVYMYESELKECVGQIVEKDILKFGLIELECCKITIDKLERLMNRYYHDLQTSESVNAQLKNDIKNEQLSWIAERNKLLNLR